MNSGRPDILQLTKGVGLPVPGFGVQVWQHRGCRHPASLLACQGGGLQPGMPMPCTTHSVFVPCLSRHEPGLMLAAAFLCAFGFDAADAQSCRWPNV